MKWPLVPLKQLAYFDPTPPRKQLIEANPTVAFMPMASVIADHSIARTELSRPAEEVLTGYTYFQDEDVLVAKITPCFENGKIAIADIEQECGFGTTEFHVIRVNSDFLDAKYLTHFLRQGWVVAEGGRKMTGSAGQRRVPRHFLEGLEISAPPIEEQRRIAAILDQAEALRGKRRQALAKLDTLTQSLFLEMFGDPFGNPNKWESATLAQVMTSGPQNGLYKPSTLYGSGTPILRIDAFYDGEISDPTQLKRVSLTEPEIALYLLRDNDIVVNRVNSREYLGKSALVVGLSEPTVFESNMMRFHVDESRVESRYLIALLQTRYIKKQIMQRCKDAVNQSSINQDDVKSFVIRIPPIDLQTTFAVRLECLRGNLRSQIKSLGRVDILTQSLQHRAFRGEL